MFAEKQVVYTCILWESNVVWHAFSGCSSNDFCRRPFLWILLSVSAMWWTIQLHVLIFISAMSQRSPPFSQLWSTVHLCSWRLVASQQQTKIKITLTWGLFIVPSWSHKWKTWMQGDRRTHISLLDMYNASKWPGGQQRVSVVWGLMWKENIYTPWKTNSDWFQANEETN